MNKLEQDIENIYSRFRRLEIDQARYKLSQAILDHMRAEDNFDLPGYSSPTAKMIRQVILSMGFDNCFHFDEKATQQEYIQLFIILRKYAKNAAFM